MTTLLTVIHIVVCLFLVVIVLLQHGKGASMGAAFGGSSQTVFGTEGPLPLLNKITTGAAVIFMLTSLTLAYISTKAGERSVMREKAQTSQSAPAAIPLPSSSEKAAAPDVPLAPTKTQK